NVTVNTFLWVSGNLVGTFTVDGWGSGTSALQPETLTFYHAQRLTFAFSSFGDPSLTGSGSDVNTVAMKVQLDTTYYPGGTAGAPTNVFPLANASTLNGSGALTAIHPFNTGGKFDLKVSRQITIVPGNVAGTYTNVGTVSVTS